MEAQSPTVAEPFREHQWVNKNNPLDSFWEERSCPVCGLQDQREQFVCGKKAEGRWRITTPCIEPTPEVVTYEDLVNEFKRHDVRERVLVIGVPGDWSVGFSIGRDGYHIYPCIEAKGKVTLEHGFALLLRWTRARQYSPNRYSDISYQAKRVSHDCPCSDDD